MIAYLCIILSLIFYSTSLIFYFGKGKSTKYISGFNSLSKKERENYDLDKIAKDFFNEMCLYANILFAGFLCANVIHQYVGIFFLMVFLILSIKNIKLDVRKSYEKYRK